MAYQLFQITKKLTSGQLLYLKACYEVRKAGPGGQVEDTRVWFKKIGNKLGHHVTGLLDRDDLALIDHGLLTGRHNVDKSGINAANGHLTDLGLMLCQNVEVYQLEISHGS